jgi:hypothetical protein
VTETTKKERGEFAPLREELELRPYLGGIAAGSEGMVQELLVDHLLAHAVPPSLYDQARAGLDPGAGGEERGASRPRPAPEVEGRPEP